MNIYFDIKQLRESILDTIHEHTIIYEKDHLPQLTEAEFKISREMVDPISISIWEIVLRVEMSGDE